MATLVIHPETSDSRLILLDKPFLLIGSAPDADVCLASELVSDRHARIEQKPDGYYIISLTSSPGVLVNGVEVTFQRLKHGDKLDIGGVKAVLLLSDEEVSAHEIPAHQEPMQEMMLPASMRSTGLATMPRGPIRCPQCGMPLMQGTPSCPHCGMMFSNLPAMPMGYIPPIQTGQAGPGILPIIAFLAALTVVGAPIALVLGLMTLSIIRRRGGTVRDRALAKWSIGLGLVWLMLGSVAALGVVRKMQKNKQLNTVEVYEAKVIRALKNLACAQKYAHTIECYDADADGHGEYGNLPVLTETKSPFFDSDLADGEAYGYWFAIREASEGQFLAVAEPVRYGETGIRTFVINQDGRIRGGDTEGQRFGQVTSMLPVLQGERSAYYEIDDEIAKDVLNYVKSLSSSLADQEKKQRILTRLRKDYALTSVGRELDGMEASVDRFVTEQRAQAIYLEAKTALKEGSRDVALAKLMELQEKHPSFSEIAAAERDLSNVRSMIAQTREQEALALFTQAEELERNGQNPQEVQQLYQRIEKLYPDTETATRVASLKPELQRQLREHSAEEIFSDLMELSPERDYDEILNRANQLRRSYSDTDLFGKVGTELAEKERKARAGSWRAKTEQSMAAGRMRAALAQLESAARENPDLLYDLRDLCIQLYRHVADALVEEGDARKALAYYEKLNQLLQASGSQDLVSQDLLAKLHNTVGQADYGLKDYAEARRHFSSAAWKYPDDAQLHMRLGAANLYTGLYRPAETALTQALDVQTNLAPARLYRAYLNMRVVLSQERVLAERLKPADPKLFTTNSPQTASNSIKVSLVSVSNTGEDGGGTTVVSSDSDDPANIAAPKKMDVKYANAGGSWFSKFAESETAKGSSVPPPTDINLFLNFDYNGSSGISPGIMTLLQDIQGQKDEKLLAEAKAKANAQKRAAILGGGVAADAVRRQGLLEARTSEQKNLSELRSQLSQLRTIHLTDTDAQQELYEMMKEMKLRIRTAASDVQAAGDTQPLIRSRIEHLLSQINQKYEFLQKAETLISRCMKEDLDLREDMLQLAEKMLLKDSISTTSSLFEGEISRFRTKIFEKNNIVKIEQALRSLRDSMDVRVELDQLLRAAEGPSSGNTEPGNTSAATQ